MPFKKHGPIRICIAFNHQKLCHLEKSQEKFGQTLDPKIDAQHLSPQRSIQAVLYYLGLRTLSSPGAIIKFVLGDGTIGRVISCSTSGRCGSRLFSSGSQWDGEPNGDSNVVLCVSIRWLCPVAPRVAGERDCRSYRKHDKASWTLLLFNSGAPSQSKNHWVIQKLPLHTICTCAMLIFRF